MPHDTSRFDTGEPAGELCNRWRTTSIEDGWHFPDDWWVPAVDEVAEALCDGRDPAAPCAALGRARATAAIGLDEALADLNALYLAVTGGTEPNGPAPLCAAPAHLVRALALGWADAMTDLTAGTYCEDSLTGLAVPAYLRIRLGEVYREAARTGLPVPATHALVVAEVTVYGGGALTGLGRAMLLGECMRTTFTGGETLCSLTPGRAVALGWRDGGLAARSASLRRLLAVQLDSFTQRPARVWVEGLPGTLPAAQRLVADLAR
jgi:hypothetical protein